MEVRILQQIADGCYVLLTSNEWSEDGRDVPDRVEDGSVAILLYFGLRRESAYVSLGRCLTLIPYASVYILGEGETRGTLGELEKNS
jgi:hypothetical protein